MADIPSRIPTRLRAGDTARWRLDLPDYPPADGWALAYTLVTTTGVISIVSAADGSAHLVEVPTATTAVWQAGRYTYQEYVTRTGERVTLSTGEVLIEPDLSQVIAGADTRSHARRVLDSIEAWLETKSAIAGSVQIGDRRVQQYPITELLALRDRYRAEVARERGSTGRVLTRF
jgi:hypothetical protein